MRLRTRGLSLACALAAAFAAPLSAQDPAQTQGDDGILVRGAFVTSRPAARKDERKDAGGAKSASAQGGAKATAKNSAGGAKTAKNASGGARAKSASRKGATPKPDSSARPAEAKAVETPAPVAGARVEKAAHAPAGLGIGYTLFMRGETGEAMRVSSAREFRSGESVRLVLETNADAYLYIFNAENDGHPQMIFPSGKLDRGANLVRAHVPHEIPSSKESDDRLRWFVFDDRPAVERLYVVVSRRPLEGVPAGEELVALCAEANCAWSPKPEHWAVIKRSNERELIATSQTRDDGRAQTAAEREALTRGIGLASDAPLPSVIHMVSSSNANILVATIDLVHR